METPPQPRTDYMLDNDQDRRIFEKLRVLASQPGVNEELVRFLYTQLEKDWRTPLEDYIDRLLQ